MTSPISKRLRFLRFAMLAMAVAGVVATGIAFLSDWHWYADLFPAYYRDDYFETWLLLISGFGEPSSWFEMTTPAEQATYRSTFKRVFLLSSFPHKVFELRLEI